MGRLVEAPRLESLSRGRGGGLEGFERGGGEKVAVGGDDFFARIAKYVPGEILAGYMSIDRLLFDFDGPGGRNLASKMTLESSPRLNLTDHQLVWVVFGLCLLATPFYIWYQARQSAPGTRWLAHATVATVGFIVWAYAIKGGVFMSQPLYDAKLAAIMVLCFTLISGMVKPRARSDGEADVDIDRASVAPPRRGGVAT